MPEDLNIAERSFGRNIRAMKILGLYPLDNHPGFYKFHAFFFYFLFTVPFAVLSTVKLMTDKNVSLAKIADDAYLIAQLGALIVKLLPLKIRPENAMRTIETLKSKIFNSYTLDQQHIMDDTIRACQKMYTIFLTCCLLTLFTWPSKVFLYSDRRFPIDLWLPFDAFTDLAIYLAMFLYIFVGVANAPLGNSALDTLVAGLICHAAGQLRILKDTLRRLNETEASMPFDNVGQQTRNQIVHGRICQCVEHYDAIYYFVKDLEKTYSLVVFSQLTASIIIICIACLQLITIEPFTVPFCAMAVYFITALTEIFLFCYYGTMLYDEVRSCNWQLISNVLGIANRVASKIQIVVESNSIVEAIYMSDWSYYDNRTKKSMIILMERAKRPMTVTAGKLLDLSLDTFSVILRRSYSLLAVLKNYY